MLQIIRDARAEALAAPRVDMPGANPEPGEIRHLVPPAAPDRAPPLHAVIEPDGVVRLSWPCRSELIGLTFSLHRGATPDFQLTDATQVGASPRFEMLDTNPPGGPVHYALAVGDARPSRLSIAVANPPPVPVISGTQAEPLIEAIRVSWEAVPWPGIRYRVFRRPAAAGAWTELTEEPLAALSMVDVRPNTDPWQYLVRAVDRRGRMGEPGDAVTVTALPAPIEPVLRFPAQVSSGKLHAGARLAGEELDLTKGGFVLLPDTDGLSPRSGFTACVRIRFDKLAKMPVVLAHGNWNQDGWFLQAIGGRWRWHMSGTSCDGGTVPTGRWISLAAVYQLGQLRLYMDGKVIAQATSPGPLVPFRGPLTIGQYTQRRGDYQVYGAIRDLRIYRRALSAGEIQDLSAQR
jgi:hypothetical protein